MGKYIQYEKYNGMKDYIKSLEEIVERERAEKKNIVLTYGVFDTLHFGHKTFLKKVKEKYPGILFVNIANDARVKYRKGAHRPINSSYNRASLLSAIEYVDYVTVHPEEKSSPAWQLASIIKPDYMVQSQLWTKEAKKELKDLLNYLPKLIRSPQHFPGTHSSKQIRKMINNQDEGESILMQFKELIPKFEELLKNNKSEMKQDESDLINYFKDISKKPKSYENIKVLINTALKIKQTYDLPFSELDAFVSKLTTHVAIKDLSDDPAISKSEDFTEDTDLLSGGD